MCLIELSGKARLNLFILHISNTKQFKMPVKETLKTKNIKNISQDNKTKKAGYSKSQIKSFTKKALI